MTVAVQPKIQPHDFLAFENAAEEASAAGAQAHEGDAWMAENRMIRAHRAVFGGQR